MPAAPFEPVCDEVSSDPSDRPLTAVYRLLRRVSRPEAPVPGWLAHRADGETVVLADPSELEGWAGLHADDSGHVLGATDLVRFSEGTRMEVPWCSERLERLLARRAEATRPLATGEAVTLAVSVRRGMAELAAARSRRASEWPRGEWWLTDASRPVFVHTDRGSLADDAARLALTRTAELAADASMRDLLARWIARSEGSGDGWADATIEAALFGLAAPSPVETTVFAPARARSLDAAARLTGEPAPEPARRGVADLLERHIDADLSGMVSDAVHRTVARLRGRARPKPWIVAGGLAAIVLVGGFLWPTGGSAPVASADAVDSHASSTPSPTPSVPHAEPSDAASPAPSAGSGDAIDPAVTAAALLDARSACRRDETCLAGVVEEPERLFPSGPVDLPPGARSITLLDEFGGAAVLRVQAADGEAAAQLVVIVESDGRWLLRDVHDVAQQG